CDRGGDPRDGIDYVQSRLARRVAGRARRYVQLAAVRGQAVVSLDSGVRRIQAILAHAHGLPGQRVDGAQGVWSGRIKRGASAVQRAAQERQSTDWQAVDPRVGSREQRRAAAADRRVDGEDLASLWVGIGVASGREQGLPFTRKPADVRYTDRTL